VHLGKILPERYGKWTTIYSRFQHWRKSSVWDKMFAELQTALEVESNVDWEVHFIGCRQRLFEWNSVPQFRLGLHAEHAQSLAKRVQAFGIMAVEFSQLFGRTLLPLKSAGKPGPNQHKRRNQSGKERGQT